MTYCIVYNTPLTMNKVTCIALSKKKITKLH